MRTGGIENVSNADPDEAITFLLWLDCLDRSAVLMLEIRHFQINVIHSLREPVLYRPLRFEERYLWGEYIDDGWYKEHRDHRRARYWLDIFNAPGVRDRDIEALARKWIIRYPMRDEPDDQYAGSDHIQWNVLKSFIAEEQRYKVAKQIRERLEEVWRHGLWSEDARRHYQTLCASQVLKSHVLRDTVILCKRAGHGFGHTVNDAHSNQDARANLLLVRSAVLRHLRDYVERLGDLQAQFERTLDLQLQEHPRPFLGRRREQGMYTSFLADRCFDIYTDIDHLLTQEFGIGASPVAKKGGHRSSSMALTPLIMHRWQHSYTSSCKLVSDELPDTPGVRPGKSDIHFINTSYWMPDRPDLQVIIAHEVSHTLLQEKYGRFDATCLPLYTDSFAKLVRLLSHCMEREGLSRNNPAVPVRSYPDLTLREVACDLLAASVYDYAYLFALCEEIIGIGLEELFLDPYNNYDLRMSECLDTLIAAQAEREWYYRLRILCAWIRAIDPQEGRSPLGDFLVAGVESAVDNILGYLCHLTPGKSRSTEFYWKTLTNRMCELVRHSEAAGVVRKWRHEKRQQNHDIDRGREGPSRLSRHSRRIPMAVRRYLYQALMRKQTKKDRALSFWKEGRYADRPPLGLCSCFEIFYFGRQITTALTSDPPPIYKHLHDISWETHVIRAIDFVHDAAAPFSRISPERWISVANESAPGRALYQIALEVDVWMRGSPVDRLSATIRMLREPQIAKQLHEDKVWDQIDSWIGNEDNTSLEAIHELWRRIKVYVKSKQRDLDRELRSILHTDFDALVLLLAHPSNMRGYGITDVTRDHMFVLEYLQEKKLAGVLAILETRQYLGPLIQYLKLRSKLESGDVADVLQALLSAFSANPYDSAAQEWQKALPDFKTYSLSRIASAGSQDEGKSASTTLKTVYAQGVWKTQRAGASTDRANPGTRVFHPVLGAHDIISIAESLPMQRWPLPGFIAGSQDDASEEQYLRFFERRERAIAVRHNSEQLIVWPHGEEAQTGEPHILAFLSVFLSQRSLRLDFVWRLLQAMRDTTRSLCQPLSQLEHISCFDKGDQIFLAQGWGDVVIAFAPNDSVDRLHQIFHIQNTLYEDFMVDRTELILSPTCLRNAARDYNNYDIITHCRTIEDRSLLHSDTAFISELVQNSGGALQLSRTPGRMDFTLVFANASCLTNSARPMCVILEMFGGQMRKIDDIVTTIGYRCSRPQQPPSAGCPVCGKNR